MNNNTKIETNPIWNLSSYRLYEEFIFVYTLILSGFLILGISTFGFEIKGLSPVTNLGVNFLWYLGIAVGMYFTPNLHQLFFIGHGEKRQQQLQEKINQIEDEQARTELQTYYELNGRLPPNRRQILALVILFWLLLFELFFISAWVKGDDHHLVWQPFWVESIWQWMNGHLMVEPPIFKDWKFFSVGIRDTMFANQYPSDAVFLATPLAKSGFIFHFWRMLSFIPLFFCLYIVLSQAIDWLGMTKVSPANIHSIGCFIFSSIATLIMATILFTTIFVIIVGITVNMQVMISPTFWIQILPYEIMVMINNIFALKLLYGWGIFWKRAWLKFFG